MLDILGVVLDDVRGGVEDNEVAVEGLADVCHLFYHQGFQLLLVHVQFVVEEVGEFGGDFAAVDVEGALGDVLDLGFNVRVPVIE